jgi:PTS system mannose-specific IID component
MVNLAYNIHGLQNVGFTFSMLPGLREIYPDEHDFAVSCRRYALFHNCHPFWGPFLTGAFLNAELAVGSGRYGPGGLELVKSTTLNSLSAIGDSLHSGSIYTAFFLLFVLLCAHDHTAVACCGLLFWFLSALAVKIITFYVGLRRGFAAVALLKHINLINLGDYIKACSAFFILFFLFHTLQLGHMTVLDEVSSTEVLRHWLFPVGVLVGFTWLVAYLHHIRIVLLSLLLFLLIF